MYNVYQREKEHREQIQIPLRTTITLYTSQSLACIYIQIFLYPLNIYLLKSTSIVLVTRISIYLSTSITSATLHPSLFHSILLFKQFSYKSNCEDILYVLCSAFLAPFCHSLFLYLALFQRRYKNRFSCQDTRTRWFAGSLVQFVGICLCWSICSTKIGRREHEGFACVVI